MGQLAVKQLARRSNSRKIILSAHTLLKPRHTHAALFVSAALTAAATAVLFAKTQVPTRRPAPSQSQAQSQPANAMNHALIVLDPAHGGPDAGARLGDQLVEKDVTLAFALRLRVALQTAGFTVLTLRDSDHASLFSTDQRAEIANRSHAVACLVLHATAAGSGIHVYTSALQPPDTPDMPVGLATGAHPAPFAPVPWDRAQAPAVRQSLRLQSDIAAAIGVANLPLVVGRASVRPLDNLTCPAVAVELAPLVADGQDTLPVTDAGYQQHVANALTRALLSWRGHADPALPLPPRPFARPGGPGGGVR